ncbi:hypothetical protein [Aquimarina sp. MMG016]|uniref:hypothetical protein n=1 Tax=Aquimarina sp. MMG016 TaxID=2822690 RepID=UPI001B3A7704|nr:hypothetical protein [Aquimarina sp. MMG016]MBQ4821690.1 hypothetical protein [Aquimarina sp. MMG016]
MKHAEYIIENNKVEVFNTLLGKESIFLNGTKVSEKYSLLGSNHYFKIGNDNYSIRPYPTLEKISGVGFMIHKNGLPIKIKSIFKIKRIKNTLRLFTSVLLGIIIGLLSGGAIGFGIVKLFFH